MSDGAKWAVIVTPTDGYGGGAWGPFDNQDEAERWRDKRIEAAEEDSDDFYKRGYVMRLDNPV